MYDKKEIGERIDYIRIRMGLSKEQFAKLIDMTPQQLGKIIKGKGGITVEKVITISKITDYSCDYILIGNDSVGSSINKEVSTIEKKAKEIIESIEKIKKINF